MRIPKAILFIALFALSVCCDKVDPVDFNPKANAGFYQTSESGKIYYTSQNRQAYRLDTVNTIPFSNVDKIMRRETGDIVMLDILMDRQGQLMFKPCQKETSANPSVL